MNDVLPCRWVIAKERSFLKAPQYQAQKEFRYKEMQYRHFAAVTIGILGLGDIGIEVGKLLKHAGFRVVALKRQASGQTNASGMEITNKLENVLDQADYLVNILPSTLHTRNLLSGDVLSSCQRKPVFINVGRGDVIDEKSIVHALEQEWISSAILDVFATEPLPKESLLWSHPSILITPHVSALSLAEDVVDVFLMNLEHYLSKSPLKYQVDWQKGY